MIEHLREALTSMLSGVTWMDETTRKLAIAKVWRNDQGFFGFGLRVCLFACTRM